MSKKELTELEVMKRKNKEIVNAKIHEVGPSMVAKMIRFVDDHYDSEDKDFRRDAHKIAGRLYDSIIPKTQVIEDNRTGQEILRKDFQMFMNSVIQKNTKMIEVEEATIIDEEAAKSVRTNGK
jgi:hypothetical protein